MNTLFKRFIGSEKGYETRGGNQQPPQPPKGVAVAEPEDDNPLVMMIENGKVKWVRIR